MFFFASKSPVKSQKLQFHSFSFPWKNVFCSIFYVHVFFFFSSFLSFPYFFLMVVR
eukprot:UN14485